MKKVRKIMVGILAVILVLILAFLTVFFLAKKKIIFINNWFVQEDSSTSGVDISSYQADVDMARLKEQHIGFVYIKATEGSSHQDDLFAVNWKNAQYGVKPMIYTRSDLYETYLEETFTAYKMWISSLYTQLKWNYKGDWYVWQYLNRGVLEGYSGGEKYIDLNVLNKEKSLDDLIVRP